MEDGGEHLLGASQSTQKLLPLTFRMDWMTIASLWLPNRDCEKQPRRRKNQQNISGLKKGKQLEPNTSERKKGERKEDFSESWVGGGGGDTEARENMNMKMRPCLPSMLTQAGFYL